MSEITRFRVMAVGDDIVRETFDKETPRFLIKKLSNGETLRKAIDSSICTYHRTREEAALFVATRYGTAISAAENSLEDLKAQRDEFLRRERALCST